MAKLLEKWIDALILPRNPKRKLHVEYIPRTAHFLNVRAVMDLNHWKSFCAITHALNGGKCMECGSTQRLECHERWHYDFTKDALQPYGLDRKSNPRLGVMKLTGLMTLCHLCHMGKHPGIAKRKGEWEKVNEHLKKVYNLNFIQLAWILRKAKKRVELQSRYEYKLDFTYLNRNRAYMKAHEKFRKTYNRAFTNDEMKYCHVDKENE